VLAVEMELTIIDGDDNAPGVAARFTKTSACAKSAMTVSSMPAEIKNMKIQ